MAIFFIGERQKDFNQLQDTDLYYKAFSKKSTEMLLIGPKSLLYTSSTPIFKRSNAYEEYSPESNPDLEQILRDSQNNFCAFQYFEKDNQKYITIASSRLGRPHLYFTKTSDGFCFSNDIRELIPYTNKRLNLDAAYSIIKYGNTPEYITCILNVFSVPLSSYLTILLDKLMGVDFIEMKEFRQYFHLKYTFEGGNIDNTEELFGEIFDFVVKQDFIVPISGGVDSTLINHMINVRTEKKYPAYFLSFGNGDNEINFAKEAVKNTKAELEVFSMHPDNFIDAFGFQTKSLIQPIGETSAISMAHIFRKMKYRNASIIDGTLGDGCYGTRNYNFSLTANVKRRSKFETWVNENIASSLQLYNLPFNDRFFPRDSMINDMFLGYMNSFSGSLSNTIFSNAAQLNKKIYEYWKWYYTLIDNAGNQGDEWLKYVAFKMPSYGTTMQVKTYDLCSNGNQIIYPFIFREILIDQGKYSWADKSKNNIVKYPLKKILEKYVNKEFVHRRKVGLNSSLEDWMLYIDNKYFLIEYLNKDNSIAEIMIGRKNLQQLKKAFLKPKHHIMITNLIVSMANIQSWCDEHKVNP